MRAVRKSEREGRLRSFYGGAGGSRWRGEKDLTLWNLRGSPLDEGRGEDVLDDEATRADDAGILPGAGLFNPQPPRGQGE